MDKCIFQSKILQKLYFDINMICYALKRNCPTVYFIQCTVGRKLFNANH